LLGNDLWLLNNELNKLINYQRALALPRQEIIVDDINQLTRGQLDQGIFVLTDALANKDKALAVQLLAEQIEQGAAEQYLLSMLIWQFRILLQIRQGLDSGLSSQKINGLLKLHPYVLQKGLNQARNFNLPSLKNIFNILIKADFKSKTSRLNLETMVDLLIVQM